jgi:hypothetical protein
MECEDAGVEASSTEKKCVVTTHVQHAAPFHASVHGVAVETKHRRTSLCGRREEQMITDVALIAVVEEPLDIGPRMIRLLVPLARHGSVPVNVGFDAEKLANGHVQEAYGVVVGNVSSVKYVVVKLSQIPESQEP